MSLQVQVHVKLPKPKAGVKYSKKFLDTIAEMWLKREPLPPRVKVTAISWNGGRAVTGAKMEDARFRFSGISEAGWTFTGVQTMGRD